VWSLKAKRISPHTIRHSTACHLLRAGVDINTVRGWLGHVSLNTTHVYAEVDLEMKAKALAHCDIPATTRPRQRLWKWFENRHKLGLGGLFTAFSSNGYPCRPILIPSKLTP
jgi:integrase